MGVFFFYARAHTHTQTKEKNNNNVSKQSKGTIAGCFCNFMQQASKQTNGQLLANFLVVILKRQAKALSMPNYIFFSILGANQWKNKVTFTIQTAFWAVSNGLNFSIWASPKIDKSHILAALTYDDDAYYILMKKMHLEQNNFFFDNIF